MQLLGPEGTRKDLPLEKWYRDAEILDVFEGRRKVQRIIIGRTLNGSRLGEDMTMVSENARHRAWKGIDPGRATGVTGTTESRYVIDDRDTPRFRVHR